MKGFTAKENEKTRQRKGWGIVKSGKEESKKE